jgi:integrase
MRVFEEFFSPDRPINSITTGELEDFVSGYREKKERSTVGNYVRRGSAAFDYAFKHEWISKNPFENLDNTGLAIKKSEEKQKRINEILKKELLQRVLTCPKVPSDPLQDTEWNALIALLRYTGCRISEALILRWCDVDFERKRLRIRGKRDGKRGVRNATFRERSCPLFKELEPFLSTLRGQSSLETKYLLNRIGKLEGKPDEDEYDASGIAIRRGRWGSCSCSNVRKTWGQILRRNQLPHWPQIFHAIRQFRINELEQSQHRPVAIREWTGNIEATAQQFYSVANDGDFDKALGINRGETGVFETAQTGSGCIAKDKTPQELVDSSHIEPFQPIPDFPDTLLPGVLVSSCEL